MSQSDWIFETNSGGSNTAVAYLPNGTVPAPSVSSGSYARSLDLTNNSATYCGFYPANPAFTGVPSSKAIRVSSYFRFSKPSGNLFEVLHARLAVKHTPLSAQGGTGSGYWLGLKDNDAQLKLYSGNTELVTLRTVAASTWYSWRLSVYPISPTQDRLIAEFESSPGANDWSSTWPLGSGDYLVNAPPVGPSNPSIYVPWGGSTKNGVWKGQRANFGEYAFLIDMLQVQLATAPVPIP